MHVVRAHKTGGGSSNTYVTPIEAWTHSQVKIIEKIEHQVTYLATMAYNYVFYTGDKFQFQLVSNFTEFMLLLKLSAIICTLGMY